VNAAKEFMAARRLFERGSISLNALLKAGSVFSLLQSSKS
jgi:3-phenylpropionate/trans-cinnamate dioxygenase ferredoxin reductase subunit